VDVLEEEHAVEGGFLPGALGLTEQESDEDHRGQHVILEIFEEFLAEVEGDDPIEFLRGLFCKLFEFGTVGEIFLAEVADKGPGI
jgi:hypothetical protein